MVTVATKFDAPIKILWPKSFTPDVPGGPLKFTLLGLGDIVMPGIFVTLCLKFDRHNAIQDAEKMGDSGVALLKSIKRYPITASYPKPYFYACLGAYISGLFTTIFVMHTFKAAQPALLYLSPACSAAPLIVAFFKGQFQDLLVFTTEKPKEDTESDGAAAAPEPSKACDSSESDSGVRKNRSRRRRAAGAKP
ncbi:hypothetical protein DSO57_1012570 [Entomophthora muscae]|uniref:Uncharacterized protein n=1 Tax=Entomophthora muscae TaxID=34485 RepID=A0ACC2UFC8_9FUNG|nr:hypothetical protein DSO57_1012570 [Entomophthora muscae]